jgi:hypothetical protein
MSTWLTFIFYYCSTPRPIPELRLMDLPENDQIWKVEDVFVCSTVQRTLHLEIKITLSILNKIQVEQIHLDDRWMAGRPSSLHTYQPLKSPSNHGSNDDTINRPHRAVLARGQSLIRSTTSDGDGVTKGWVRRSQSDLSIEVLLLRRCTGAVFRYIRFRCRI